MAALANRCDLPALSAADLEDGMLKDAATVVVDAVAARRATFTRSNVLAEALRQLHGVRFTTPHERAHAAERVTAMALDASVQLTPPEVGRVPATLQRPDGSTRLRARDATIYTTTGVLQAEERLLAAGRATDGPQVPAVVAAAAAGAPLPGRTDGRRLTAEQADAVCRVVTSGRALDVLVGAAGTGKSTTMAGVRAAWEAAFGRGSVVGLAPSAAAAEVLADAVGVPTENTAKWLTEQARQDQRLAELASLQGKLRGASPSLRTRALTRRARQVRAELDRWRLRHGQLVIVDEASMAGTLELDTPHRPSPRRSGRRCCWSGTRHSCPRSPRAAPSGSWSPTGQTRPNWLTCAGSGTNGKRTPAWRCATANTPPHSLICTMGASTTATETP